MIITVIKVNVEEKAGTKGSYKLAELVYKSEGKVKTFKVPSWNKAVFDVVAGANPDDNLDVKFEKDSKNYWQMTSATSAGKDAAPKVGASATPKGNWETTEERAARQVYIVRQSSITNAIEFLNSQPKTKFEVSDVLNVAKQFEAFVFGNPAAVEVTGDVE